LLAFDRSASTKAISILARTGMLKFHAGNVKMSSELIAAARKRNTKALDATENRPDDEESEEEVSRDGNDDGHVARSKRKGRKPQECSTTLQGKWDEMFSRLVTFRRKHGHCLGMLLTHPTIFR
jgi:hypothetical protein